MTDRKTESTARAIRAYYNARLQTVAAKSVAALEHQVATGRSNYNAMWAMLTAWGDYAEHMRTRLGWEIGDDGVLGDGWEDIAKGLRTLLNGDTGGLDGGTCDAIILDTLSAYGIDTSEW